MHLGKNFTKKIIYLNFYFHFYQMCNTILCSKKYKFVTTNKNQHFKNES